MPPSLAKPAILIKSGRVYDHDGDTDDPPVADILIRDGTIAAIRPGIADLVAAGEPVPELLGRRVDEVIDAADHLVLPGFVNAHYHSHDVLLKGCFETIPLELWVLSALPPSYPKRSRAEIRARTLLGAIECLRSGITTVQDLCTIYPYDPQHVDAVLDAYEDVGIRCVFALQVTDVPAVKSIPFWDEIIPAEMRASLSGAVEPFSGVDVFSLVRDLVKSRRDRHDRITWALGPTSPERCSEGFLGQLATLSAEEDLPVYSHIYESKAMTLIAREEFGRDEGSLIKYLERCGLLTPRLSLAHSVWMLPREIDMLAKAGSNVVLNPVGNLKTRSGVPPIRGYVNEGVNIGLGCDNCSCSDAQNMFQSMKLFTSLAGITHPEPGRPYAVDAIRAATLGGAQTAGLQGKVGALTVGAAADMSILDLSDPSFVPFNSAARQIVYTECSRSVRTVLVDGKVVLRHGKVTTVDEKALRLEIAELMVELRRDVAKVVERNERMMPYLLEAYRRTWEVDIGLERYVGRGIG